MAKELSALGERPRVDEGGVAWDGDARSMMRANLWLRTASRVLARVATFRATEFYELEKRARKIPWRGYLGDEQPAEFRVTARKSKLYHSDAIAERLLRSVGARPASPDGTAQLFIVRVVRDVFTISADTSGELLHMRGYRQASGKAPLRETLAAALLLAAEWTGDTPLLDPLCGSGTIPIEAALIARRMAPGFGRDFAFMRWQSFRERDWKALLSSARTTALASSPVPIAASDRDAGAVQAARDNAERAGAGADIALSVRALSSMLPPAKGPGLIATNPPYGKRLSEGRDLRNLYAQLGNVARQRFSGWRLALFSPDARLTEQVGFPMTEALHTVNGGIRVLLMTGSAPGTSAT